MIQFHSELYLVPSLQKSGYKVQLQETGNFKYFRLLSSKWGSQWGNVSAAKGAWCSSEDLSSVPSSHTRWLTTIWNFSSRVSNDIFWLLWACVYRKKYRGLKAEPSWQCALLCRQAPWVKPPILHEEYIFLVHVIFVLRRWRSLGPAWNQDCFKTKNKLDKQTLPYHILTEKGQVSKQKNLNYSKKPGPSG